MINQILSDILMNIYTYCPVSFLLAILTSIILVIVNSKGIDFLYELIAKNIRKSKLIKQTIFLFFIYLILNRTVLGRNAWVNPWSDVLGKWSIFMDDGSLNIDFIENMMLFVPLGFMYNLTYNDSNFLNMVKKTLLGSLLFSILIECTQLMLKVGVFQLSDIFCNTVGGVIGAIVYILVKMFGK